MLILHKPASCIWLILTRVFSSLWYKLVTFYYSGSWVKNLDHPLPKIWIDFWTNFVQLIFPIFLIELSRSCVGGIFYLISRTFLLKEKSIKSHIGLIWKFHSRSQWECSGAVVLGVTVGQTHQAVVGHQDRDSRQTHQDRAIWKLHTLLRRKKEEKHKSSKKWFASFTSINKCLHKSPIIWADNMYYPAFLGILLHCLFVYWVSCIR